MKNLRTVHLRLTLDIAVRVRQIDPSASDALDRDLAELCSRIQGVVLRNRKLLDQQIDLALSIFLDILDGDELKAMLHLDAFDPYRHPAALLEAINEDDAKVLRAAGQYLSESLNDLTHSFQAEITTVAVEHLSPRPGPSDNSEHPSGTP